MCGRYTQTVPLSEWENEFDFVSEIAELEPRYNLAPTQEAPLILEDEGVVKLEKLRWGLVPHWAQSLTEGPLRINARSETADTLPSFREAFRLRRALAPADGFFEWPTRSKKKGPKSALYFHRKGFAPFFFAALWDRWIDPDGRVHRSFAILTTSPNSWVSRVHDRMPVMLGRDAARRWMDSEASPDDLGNLLNPFPDSEMEAYEVSERINRTAHEGPACIERATFL